MGGMPVLQELILAVRSSTINDGYVCNTLLPACHPQVRGVILRKFPTHSQLIKFRLFKRGSGIKKKGLFED